MTQAQKLARAAGFQFLRNGKGSHQIWVHPATGQTVLLSKNLSGRAVANFRAELKRKSLPVVVFQHR